MSVFSLFKIGWLCSSNFIHIWKVHFWMTSYCHQTIHYWMIHVLHFLMIYFSEGLIHYWKILDICFLDVCIIIRN